MNVQESMIRLDNILWFTFFSTCSRGCKCQQYSSTKKLFDGEPPPIQDTRFAMKSEAGSTRLIRTACNAFARWGDPKHGCHGRFIAQESIQTFLRENELWSLPIQPSKGNHFKFLFHSAGAIFFLHEKRIEFLKVDKSNSWVLSDLLVPEYVARYKALGLISTFITTLLWNVIKNKDVHIMDLNKHCVELTEFLTEAHQNIPAFMEGKLKLSFAPVKEDAILLSLLKPSNHDATTQVCLTMQLAAIVKLFIRFFGDFLPGGKFCNVEG